MACLYVRRRMPPRYFNGITALFDLNGQYGWFPGSGQDPDLVLTGCKINGGLYIKAILRGLNIDLILPDNLPPCIDDLDSIITGWLVGSINFNKPVGDGVRIYTEY